MEQIHITFDSKEAEKKLLADKDFVIAASNLIKLASNINGRVGAEVMQNFGGGKENNQIKKIARDIESILNDFEGGITEKEETIINLADYILQRAEMAVKNFAKELDKNITGKMKWYEENNRPDNATTCKLILDDMRAKVSA